MPAQPVDQQIVFFYTRDLAATARFYEDFLGLELARDQGDCRIYRVCASAYLGFCRRAEASQQPSGVILTLVSRDVDAWYEHLTARGVSFDRPPEHNPKYAIYHCFLRDPNGYLIEIQRFEEPLP